MCETGQGSGERKHVVRSETDGGYPGLEFDDAADAEQRAAELNKEHGLPTDHKVVEEVDHV